MKLAEVLVKPILSEKANQLSEKDACILSRLHVLPTSLRLKKQWKISMVLQWKMLELPLHLPNQEAA